MIYAIETYQVKRSDHAAFVQFVEAEVWPALEASGAQRVGLWCVILGGPERVFMMTRYEDVGHWQDCQDWQSDLWQGIGQASVVENADSMIVRPITSIEPTEAPEADPGIYTVRTFQIDMKKDLPKFIDLSENRWWPWVRLGEGVRPICQWTTIISDAPRIYMMTRYDSLSHWEGHQLGNARETLADSNLQAIYDDALIAIEQRREIVKETSVKILKPMSRALP